jgi:hypothetical protein
MASISGNAAGFFRFNKLCQFQLNRMPATSTCQELNQFFDIRRATLPPLSGSIVVPPYFRL